MTTLTMDMSSYEIECSDQPGCRDEAAGRNPALQSIQEESDRAMPADLIFVDAGVFIRKMHAIETSAEVFLKNMYIHQG